jgi:hypothetical protein
LTKQKEGRQEDKRYRGASVEAKERDVCGRKEI